MSTDYLTLRENFRTGIDRVDEQHREMIECYNDLEFAVATAAPHNHRVAALESLLDATRRHFHFEETLLKANAYPDLVRHCQEHVVLLAQIEDWTRRLRDDELNLTRDTMRLIRDWLVDHMVGSDQHYIAHIQQAD